MKYDYSFNSIFNTLSDWFDSDSIYTAYPFNWLYTSNATKYRMIDIEKEYAITIALPGCKKEDIDISYKKKDLYYNIILNLKNDTYNVSKGEYVFPINKNVDIKSISAKLEDGILSIVVKKDESVDVDGKVTVN